MKNNLVKGIVILTIGISMVGFAFLYGREMQPNAVPGDISVADFEELDVKNTRDVYVDQTSQNGGDGSFAAPYQTIRAALAAAQPGDAITVRGGTYHEQLTFDRSGTAEAWLTLTNYQDEVVTIDGGAVMLTDDMEGLVNINDQSYIHISGLSFCNLTSDNDQVPVGILITGASHHLNISDCDVSKISTTNRNVEAANAHGIAVYGTDKDHPIHDLVIANCRVFENRLGLSEAVVLNGHVEEFLISQNEVYQNDNIGIDFIGFEGTAAENDRVRKGICIGNRVWQNSTKENPSYMEASAAGIYVDGGQDIVIEGNTVYACDIGIEAASEHKGKTTKRITIRNNLVYRCQAIAGIAFGGYDASRGRAEDIVITNNTLVDNAVHVLVQYHAQTNSNQVLNNIFYQGQVFDGDLTHILTAHNYTGSPLFVDEDKDDFRLQANSEAVGAAQVNAWVGDKDFAGNPRVVADQIDVGAYQSSAY